MKHGQSDVSYAAGPRLRPFLVVLLILQIVVLGWLLIDSSVSTIQGGGLKNLLSVAFYSVLLFFGVRSSLALITARLIDKVAINFDGLRRNQIELAKGVEVHFSGGKLMVKRGSDVVVMSVYSTARVKWLYEEIVQIIEKS